MSRELSRKEWDVQAIKWLEHHCKKHWDRLGNLYGYEKIGPLPKIKISWRLQKGYAAAIMYPEEEKNRDEIKFAGVHLAPAENRAAYETVIIPHELCHHAAFRLFGEHTHGKKWKMLMNRLGVDSRVKINAKDYAEPETWYNPETKRKERI